MLQALFPCLTAALVLQQSLELSKDLEHQRLPQQWPELIIWHHPPQLMEARSKLWQ
jgi:hypothetical protein